MKKLLLMAAVLLGGVAASQAGVSVNIGFGSLFPRPHEVIIGHRAPVVVAHAPVCAPPARVVVAQPHYCPPAPVVVVPRRDWDAPRYTHYEHRSYGGHQNERYERSDYGRSHQGHDGRNDRRDNDNHNGWYSQNSHSGSSYRR